MSTKLRAALKLLLEDSAVRRAAQMRGLLGVAQEALKSSPEASPQSRPVRALKGLLATAKSVEHELAAADDLKAWDTAELVNQMQPAIFEAEQCLVEISGHVSLSQNNNKKGT